MANIKSINGNPIVLDANGISDRSVSDSKLVRDDGVLDTTNGLRSLAKHITSVGDMMVYRVPTSSSTESATGTRLRIVLKIETGFSFAVRCTGGSGLDVALIGTKDDAIRARNFIKHWTSAYTTSEVTGEWASGGYLTLSIKKADGSAITDEEMESLIAATSVDIRGEVIRRIDAVEEAIENIPTSTTTSALNADMDTALAAASDYNHFDDGSAAEYTTKKGKLSLAVITDIHGTPGSLTRFVGYANSKKKYLDAAVCLGDSSRSNPSNDVTWVDAAIRTSEVPFFYVVGNHDIADTGAASITEATARTRFFDAIEDEGWLAASDFVGSNKCSWSKDFDDYGVRIIAPFEYANSEAMASGSPSSYCRRWLTTETLQWFADKLYSTPTGYAVVVLLHQVPYNQVTYEESKFTAIHGYREEPPHFLNTVDGNPIEEIVDAFQNSTSISKTYQSIASYSLGKTATVSKDFSGRSEDGHFACYIVGHAHTAYVLHSSNYQNQTTVVVNTGSESAFQRHYGDIGNDSDTRNRDSFYIVGIDTENKRINLVQIGGQATLDMRRRDFEAIGY